MRRIATFRRSCVRYSPSIDQLPTSGGAASGTAPALTSCPANSRASIGAASAVNGESAARRAREASGSPMAAPLEPVGKSRDRAAHIVDARGERRRVALDRRLGFRHCRDHPVGQVVDQTNQEVPGSHRRVADAQTEDALSWLNFRHPSAATGAGSRVVAVKARVCPDELVRSCQVR